ncbi:hypothetical protein PENANT_c027G08314 [Penicillium antarcticum]|uniref:Uncharacterized protein n=1 Tax=Penicillium antarcticum TaxID=416450 RepID=A0A1V6PWJ4_9EURO|nr:hypothetical protein PENANT_c027G08314 [Penicillium antarcticum]
MSLSDGGRATVSISTRRGVLPQHALSNRSPQENATTGLLIQAQSALNTRDTWNVYSIVSPTVSGRANFEA